MSALSNIQFQHVEGPTMHYVDAGEDANFGHIAWDKRSGRVDEVFVPEEHRRKGIATALYTTAHKVAKEKGLTPPTHSETRTSAGEAWTQTLPDYKPAQRIED